jgi:beta-glucosidase
MDTSGGSGVVKKAAAGYETAVEAAVGKALRKLDLEAKVGLLTGINFWATHAAPRIGLRSMIVSDGPVGVKGGSLVHDETTTLLPSPTALAASWDEELVREIGGLLAGEARRKGVDVLLGPTINLHRSPVGGRHFEQFSEDPLLTGRIAVAYVRGLQSRGVGGCPKHYVCNDSETERRSLRVDVGERPLRELYLAPFERVVREAGAWSVMAAYNGVRKHRMTESPLLTDPLKAAWGFDGLVVSDWYAVHSTVAAGRAALDLIMPGPESPWGEALVAAVKAGEVPEAAVDDKVRRILRLAARVGALEGVAPASPVAVRRVRTEVSTLVRRASASGSVLLRNNGLLPLDATRVRKLALLGPNTDTEPEQGGGSANLRPDYTVTPLEGLRAALPAGVSILWNPAEKIRPGLHRLAPSEASLPNAAGARSGQPGLLVRICEPGGGPLSGDIGREVGREVRPDGRLSWAGDARFAGRPVVELTTRITSDVSGRHRIGLGTRGEVAIWVDGHLAFEGGEGLDTDDIDALWHNPPFATAEVDLEAGRPVEVRIRWRKFYDHPAVFATLSMEKPAPTPQQTLAEDERLARSADAVVLMLGTTHLDESEGGDRASLALSPVQDELARRVLAANQRTVVVVSAGSPVLMPWRDQAAAILLTWFPGQEAGNALADLLLGVSEPGGRLPTTWPARTEDVPVLDTRPHHGVLRYAEGLHIGYRAWLKAGTEPAFPFGHGLGYTEWRYVSAEAAQVDGGPAVRVRLQNVGPRRGREVVQLYLSRPGSAVERPVRWLGGYAVVEAAPGEETEVAVTVDRWALRHWDVGGGDWVVEPGRFDVGVGRSVADIRLTTSIEPAAGAFGPTAVSRSDARPARKAR